MWAFAKAVLLASRYLRRIAVAIELIAELYELDLRSRDIFRAPAPGARDESELLYGPKVPKPGERTAIEDWDADAS